MRIRFLTDQTYERAPGKGPFFPEGYVLDSADVAHVLDDETVTAEWAEGFLRRWTQRAVAEEVDGRTPTTLEGGESAPEPHQVSSPGAKQKKPKAPAKLKADAPLGTAKRGRAAKGIDDGKQVVKTDLTKLSLDELKVLAAKGNIDVGDAETEADFIAAIELAAEAK